MSTSAAPSVPGGPSLATWRNALLGIFGVMGFSTATLLSRLPSVRDLLDIDSGAVGAFIAVFSIGALGGLAVAGRLTARLGARRLILLVMPIGGVLLAATGLAAGVARSYPLLLGVIVLVGVTISLSDVPVNVSGTANERALGRTVMPLFHAGYSIGYVLGAAVSALAETLGVPLWLHALVVGAIGVATPLLAARWLPAETVPVAHSGTATTPSSASEPPGPARPARIWREPRTWAIGLLVFGFAYTEGAATDWLALGVVDGRGFDNASAAGLLAAFMAAMTLGRLLGSRIVDRLGRFPVLAVGAALAFLGLVLVIHVPVPWVIWVCVVLWGLGTSLGFPLGMSAAGDDPETATARVSAVAVIGYTAFLVGPSAVGLIAQASGVLPALHLVLGLIVLAGACTPWTRERHRSGRIRLGSARASRPARPVPPADAGSSAASTEPSGEGR